MLPRFSSGSSWMTGISMHRWGPRLDWEHLQNWLPGVLGGGGAILQEIVAANSPTQINSKPAEAPSSQSAAQATKGQTGSTPSPSQPAAPQTSFADKTARAPDTPPPAASTGAAAKPAPMHDHAVVKAESAATPAPVQSPAEPNKESQKAVADAGNLQGDAVAGRQVFKKCQACHSLDPGKTILGPSLAGIVGRKSGAEPNFSYSPALKQAALTWDAATLDGYLMDPQKIVPGNRMPFPGLKTDRDRKDVIAFLATPASPAASNPKAAAPSAAAAAPQTKPGNN